MARGLAFDQVNISKSSILNCHKKFNKDNYAFRLQIKQLRTNISYDMIKLTQTIHIEIYNLHPQRESKTSKRKICSLEYKKFMCTSVNCGSSLILMSEIKCFYRFYFSYIFPRFYGNVFILETQKHKKKTALLNLVIIGLGLHIFQVPETGYNNIYSYIVTVNE